MVNWTGSIGLRLLLILHLGVWPLESAFGEQVKALPNDNRPKIEIRVSKSPLNEDRKIIQVLNRFGFGPRPGDIEKARQIGIKRYFDLQLHPEKIRDLTAEAKLRPLETLKMNSAQLVQNFPPPRKLAKFNDEAVKEAKKEKDMREAEENREARMNVSGPQRVIRELSQAKVLRAVYSERQLFEVMVDFWENHFNVFASKGADKWLITSYDRDVIRPHALGKFKDLLLATAESPAMLFYLDNWLSVDPNASVDLSKWRRHPANRNPPYWNRGMGYPRRGLGGIGPFPRFPRERMPSDRRPDPAAQSRKNQKRGLNENYARELMELHTLGVDGGYTQKDVTEVARCFTGWTIVRPRVAAEFTFAKALHDDREKVVLGHRIPAGGGIKDGERVIDILVHHPSTAQFIATKLARRFVSDNPPQALVDRVAETFRKTEGDIPSLLKTIYASPEFYSFEAYRAKVKTPFELVVSAIRSVGAETDAGKPIIQVIAQMGEPLFMCQPPTGYPDVAEAWINAGALLNRLNFSLALAANRLAGTVVDLRRFTRPPGSEPGEAFLGDFAQLLLQDDISPQTLATLKKQMKESEDTNSEGPKDPMQAAKIVGLLLGSPEFQRQ